MQVTLLFISQKRLHAATSLATTDLMNRHGFLSSFSLIAAVALAISLLPACATKTSVNSALMSAVTSHHVQGRTATKVQNGQTLNYRDIYHLVKAKVPTSTITAYLQSTEKSYQFTPGQLDSLRHVGASSQLINYLNESKGFYTTNATTAPNFSLKHLWDNMFGGSVPKSQFTGGGVMDPAYEESLFSPFYF